MSPVARASTSASARSVPLSCMRRSPSASSCCHRWNVTQSVSRAPSSWSETSAAMDPRAQPYAPFWAALRWTNALRQRTRPLNEFSRDSCASSRASTRAAHSSETARTRASLSAKWLYSWDFEVPLAARTSSRVVALTPWTYISSAAASTMRARVAAPRAVSLGIRAGTAPTASDTGGRLPEACCRERALLDGLALWGAACSHVVDPHRASAVHTRAAGTRSADVPPRGSSSPPYHRTCTYRDRLLGKVIQPSGGGP